MKKAISIIMTTVFIVVTIFCFGQQETRTEKKISYSFINEYGFALGGSFDAPTRHGFGFSPHYEFSAVFVNGICFNKTQDHIGIGIGYEINTLPVHSIPLFVNYRHYFPNNKKLKPFVNFGIGPRILFWDESIRYSQGVLENEDLLSRPRTTLGLYNTIVAGFKVNAFSFSSGIFMKTWHDTFNVGFEVKVGFTL